MNRLEKRTDSRGLSPVAMKDHLTRLVRDFPYTQDSTYQVTIQDADLDQLRQVLKGFDTYILVQELPNGTIKRDKFLKDYTRHNRIEFLSYQSNVNKKELSQEDQDYLNRYGNSNDSRNQWSKDSFVYHYHILVNSRVEPGALMKQELPNISVVSKLVYSNSGGGYLKKQLDNIARLSSSTSTDFSKLFYYAFK